MNVHRVNNVMQTETHAAECNRFWVETDTAKLKNDELPNTGQIPAELIQTGGETLCSEIYKLINSNWSKES
jgi:hypothetical protein